MSKLKSASRLEEEVDEIISAVIRVGRGGALRLESPGGVRTFTVDRLVCDESGHVCEAWLSAPSVTSLARRVIDWFKAIERRDLVRVTQHGGTVRRSMTTVEIAANGVTHLAFRDDLGASRYSRTISTSHRPPSDASGWLLSYRRAS
ncbi:MAG: hypothetical protein EB084_05935 [Proteobacteria bacterium]|nr:hypothetical protein [Pseudomonadota bacterium]